MARVTEDGAAHIYAAAELWIERALRSDDSLFTPGVAVWARESVEELYERFVDAPGAGGGSFEAQLEMQLAGSRPETVQLMAEVMYLHLLPALKYRPATKRKIIRGLLEPLPSEVEIPEALDRALDHGLLNEGPHYKTGRYWLLCLVIRFARQWKRLDADEQQRLLSEPWGFKSFIAKIGAKGAKAQQHALVHLVFPEKFEPIVSDAYKKKLAEAFVDRVVEPEKDRDRLLLQIREQLESEAGSAIDFFSSPLFDEWNPPEERWVDDLAELRKGIASFAAALAKGDERTEFAAIHPGYFVFDPESGSIAPSKWAALRGATPELYRQLVDDKKDKRAGWFSGTTARKRIAKITQREFVASDELGRKLVEMLRSGLRKSLIAQASEGWRFLELPRTSSPDPVSHPLNQILFGPPGTGKTYETARIAVEICDGVAPEDRRLLQARYHELLSERRVSFVTFHQSYSYEEFVEGIRPVLAGDARTDIQYECRAGVFKELCQSARKAGVKSTGRFEFDADQQRVWKMSLGDSTSTEDAVLYEECTDNGYVLLGWGGPVDFTGAGSLEEVRSRLRESGVADADTTWAAQAVDWFKNKMAVGDLVVVSDGNVKFRAIGEVTGDYQFFSRDDDRYQHRRDVRWLAVFDESLGYERFFDKRLSQQTLYELKHVRMEAFRELLSAGEEPESHNYVLVVDEINRGNISKILGELITLLEEDKRTGADHELQVQLPYSQSLFGVPSNVYVVGTMNTADRSIALLDVALRRRFRFRECLPDTDVIREFVGDDGVLGEIDVARLVEVLNRRIETLYDRDHTLGHAYFLRAESLGALRDCFVDQVIPLLQEYFYGDVEKISAVLGCGYTTDGAKVSQVNKYPLLRVTSLEAIDGFDAFDVRVSAELDPDFLQASEDDLPIYFGGIAPTEAE